MRAVHLLFPDTKRKGGWRSLDGKGFTASFSVSELIIGMPYDLTFNQIDHFFRNIGRVIADAFQMS